VEALPPVQVSSQHPWIFVGTFIAYSDGALKFIAATREQQERDEQAVAERIGKQKQDPFAKPLGPIALADSASDTKPGTASRDPKNLDLAKAVVDGIWLVCAPPGGNCRVLMPSTPTPQTFKDPTPHGEVTRYAYTCIQRSDRFTAAFTLQYADLPPGVVFVDANASLDESIELAVKGSGGKQRSSKPILLDGNPGRDFEVDGYKVEGKPGLYRGRFYIVGNRKYLVGVELFADNANAPEVTKFLDSFALTKAVP
jgi:hypothetical protein